MRTRSVIAKRTKDNHIIGIYCHFGGYPEHHELILKNHYNSTDKVNELLTLGDISSLGIKVKPDTQEHSFESKEDDCTVAYHRDRGEELNPATDLGTNFEMVKIRALNRYDAEYLYIWDMFTESWSWYNLY